MHLITEDPMKGIKPKGAPNTGMGGTSKRRALRDKIVDKTSDVLSYPKRKIEESRSRGHDRRYKFMKDYQAKAKSGVASNKDRAIFLALKNK